MMKILIIGCGHLGSGLAITLDRRGQSVAVIDMNVQAFEKLGDKFKGQIIPGIGFDREVLVKAGIERADGLAAVTSSDEANVVAASIARDIFHVPRVVARLYDVRQAEIYNRLGLQTIAPTSWGISRITELLLYSPLETVYSIGSGDVELVEVEAPALLIGKTARDLTAIGEIHVVCMTRENKTFLPTLGTIFQEGDILHLAVLRSSASRLNQLLGY
jgi:trk system potassium uptake protein TrkA